MTFSIVARSADGESWGVAVASKFLAVGAVVPAAVAGVGAVATQADANVAYKGLALAHLDEGATAPVALQRLLEEDDGRDERQVGIVDVDGGAASHTGHACLDWAGSITGPDHTGYAIQGNILAGDFVVAAMQDAYEASDPDEDLARRLLAALVLLEQSLQGDRGGGPLVEVGEREALVRDVRIGLGGDRADTGDGGRHDCAHGQELGGDGNAPRLAVGGPRHDGERHGGSLGAPAARGPPPWAGGSVTKFVLNPA